MRVGQVMLSISKMRGLACVAILSCVLRASAQSSPDSNRDYTVTLPVDEVVLLFHAADAHGLPVNDIKAGEIKVLDNGAAPKRLIAFDALLERPLRAAILLDTSGSMDQSLLRTKLIAERFAEQVFRKDSDQALVTQFGYSSVVVRPWTGDTAAIERSIQGIRQGQANPLPGTALIDSVFRTCYHGFGTADSTATGNFILLLSDGEDISSHTTAEEALRVCQRSNTVIYAFRVPAPPEVGSVGARTLADLAEKSGGRVFPVDESEDAISNDLRIIESEMRNQYRLVYHPAQFKHDGAFHSIELQLPDRVSRVEIRPGYFAPQH
jgi:Ca-activated chloride channel homolog